MYPILLYLRIGVCVIIVININVYPVLFFLFSPVCVVIRQNTSSPRLPIPRSIAQETRCYVCMPIRALYLYAEPIVEPLFLLYLNSS